VPHLSTAGIYGTVRLPPTVLLPLRAIIDQRADFLIAVSDNDRRMPDGIDIAH